MKVGGDVLAFQIIQLLKFRGTENTKGRKGEGGLHFIYREIRVRYPIEKRWKSKKSHLLDT